VFGAADGVVDVQLVNGLDEGAGVWAAAFERERRLVLERDADEASGQSWVAMARTFRGTPW
jgi:hypothetical protein